MIPEKRAERAETTAFPRMSGDDPILVMYDYAGNILSPHERG